jgi:hypothetical protein
MEKQHHAGATEPTCTATNSLDLLASRLNIMTRSPIQDAPLCARQYGSATRSKQNARSTMLTIAIATLATVPSQRASLAPNVVSAATGYADGQMIAFAASPSSAYYHLTKNVPGSRNQGIVPNIQATPGGIATIATRISFFVLSIP